MRGQPIFALPAAADISVVEAGGGEAQAGPDTTFGPCPTQPARQYSHVTWPDVEVSSGHAAPSLRMVKPLISEALAEDSAMRRGVLDVNHCKTSAGGYCGPVFADGALRLSAVGAAVEPVAFRPAAYGEQAAGQHSVSTGVAAVGFGTWRQG